MKSALLLLSLTFAFNTFAGERVILQDHKAMTAKVDRQHVRCSSLGYGMKELKINIEGLDGWTLFDHTNDIFGDRTGLPCMTAGACKFRANEQDGISIDDIIQGNEREEKIVVKRKVVEIRDLSEIDGAKVCIRHLREEIATSVGGVAFNHLRIGASETFPERACRF
jgi:hypothetical protein